VSTAFPGRIRTVLADDIAFWSTTRQAAAVRAREFSARAPFELYTARIEQSNTAINEIVTLDLDRASRDAAMIDERLARGEDVGPLAGIPMTIKDAIAVAGIPRTFCSLQGSVACAELAADMYAVRPS